MTELLLWGYNEKVYYRWFFTLYSHVKAKKEYKDKYIHFSCKFYCFVLQNGFKRQVERRKLQR